MRTMILLLFVAASAHAAGWQRHVVSGKGEVFDLSQAHRLAYFTQDPFLRDDGDQFCSDCSAKGKATVHRRHRWRTEVVKVGTLHGFAIYDIFYFFDDHVDTGEIDWKSILIRVSPEEFHELYHLQPTAAKIDPAFLLKAGANEILATRDLIPGTGNNYYEDYFWFSSVGVVRIDIKAVSEAAKSTLPTGSDVRKGGGLDMQSMVYRAPVWKPSDGNCCPSGGMVTVKFRLKNGRVFVTSKHFDPAAKP